MDMFGAYGRVEGVEVEEKKTYVVRLHGATEPACTNKDKALSLSLSLSHTYRPWIRRVERWRAES